MFLSCFGTRYPVEINTFELCIYLTSDFSILCHGMRLHQSHCKKSELWIKDKIEKIPPLLNNPNPVCHSRLMTSIVYMILPHENNKFISIWETNILDEAIVKMTMEELKLSRAVTWVSECICTHQQNQFRNWEIYPKRLLKKMFAKCPPLGLTDVISLPDPTKKQNL